MKEIVLINFNVLPIRSLSGVAGRVRPPQATQSNGRQH